MSWAENLQPASFRGVTFDVLKTSESITRDHAVYMYPNVDGGDVEDLGRKPRPYQMTAFIWGDEYEFRLQGLIECLDTPGAGELVHPVYGTIPSAIVTGYNVHHDANNPDSCSVELSFLEAGTGTPLFSKQLPEQFAAKILNELDAMNAEMASFFNELIAPLNTINTLVKRAETIESTFINTLLIFKDDVEYTARQMVLLAKSPAAFVRELGNVLSVHTSDVASSVPALESSAPTTTIGLPTASAVAVAAPATVMSSWGTITDDMDDLVALPASLVNGTTTTSTGTTSVSTQTVPLPSGATVSDVQDVTIMYQAMAVAELTSTATAVLSDNAQADVLTQDDIGQLINDIRTRAQSAIDALRARYQPMQPLITVTRNPTGIRWQPIVSSLKTAALNVQSLGLLVLSRRPPLTRKQVTADSSFILLAHLWYADYQRAAELHRLNPDITNPNTITAGTLLNAYAK